MIATAACGELFRGSSDRLEGLIDNMRAMFNASANAEDDQAVIVESRRVPPR
jgi:hypothetical protein